ncbi:MAG: InlB B-repeat-containing protein [Spirochaetaceae bacterium]|jgi:uncharacterized repeat protein (TIGR02543 family)|nr:InlB B-repeat-containing protein [Spirochaetaceae bacterium]
MKRNIVLVQGMLAALLALNLVFAGCENGTTDDPGDDPKTLVITGITQDLLGYGTPSIKIGIFPVGTSLEQASQQTGIVAGADSEQNAVTLSQSAPYTATALLYVPDNSGRWTGSGTYDIYILVNGDSYYLAQNVSFNDATTTVDLEDFTSPLSSYTVTFEGNGGIPAPESQTITEGKKISPPPAMTKSGYVFEAWYKEATFTSPWNFSSDTVKADTTLYANWTVVPQGSLAVTFETNGGTSVPGQVVTSGGNVTKPTDPTRDGYSFSGWYKEATLTSPWNFSSDTVSANTTLYASWTPTTYSIMYHLDGGTNSSANPATYTVESPAINLAAPTRANYDFAGWYTTSSLSGSQVTSIPKGSTGDKTFYARWTPITYSIMYHLDGGTNSSANPATYTVESQAISLAAPARANYDFAGWYATASFSGSPVTVIPAGSTGDKTFYARWTQKNNPEKTLVITGITEDLLGYGTPSIQIGIFTGGTSPDQALQGTGIVAGADSVEGAVTLSQSAPYTATASLYVPGSGRWTGSGTYDIYIVVGGNNYYRAQKVSFNDATTTVSAGAFSSL